MTDYLIVSIDGGGLQYTLPTPWGMDDWQAVPDMIAFADTVDIGPVIAWLSAT